MVRPADDYGSFERTCQGRYSVTVLTPMLVQYLVGLCCLRRNPDAVDVTLGDMVPDATAGKKRDVDVTVTLKEGPSITRAFKAYEVKREGKALDITVVEQLSMKLLDMPSVTHRAIVSASGFTEPAKAKAAHHGIELYEMQAWAGNLEDYFPNWGMAGPVDEALQFGGWSLLYWRSWTIKIVAPDGPSNFSVKDTDALYTSSGDLHLKFRSFGDLKQALVLRSTGILFTLEPAQTILQAFPMGRLSSGVLATPSWPHTHTLDVSADEAYLRPEGRLAKIETATIYGRLQWEKSDQQPQYYIMRRIPDGEVFSGAMVGLGPEEGHMLGFVLSPESQSAGVHRVQLKDEQLSLIRQLKLTASDGTAGES